jgi:hypothetical protein
MSATPSVEINPRAILESYVSWLEEKNSTERKHRDYCSKMQYQLQYLGLHREGVDLSPRISIHRDGPLLHRFGIHVGSPIGILDGVVLSSRTLKEALSLAESLGFLPKDDGAEKIPLMLGREEKILKLERRGQELFLQAFPSAPTLLNFSKITRDIILESLVGEGFAPRIREEFTTTKDQFYEGYFELLTEGMLFAHVSIQIFLKINRGSYKVGYEASDTHATDSRSWPLHRLSEGEREACYKDLAPRRLIKEIPETLPGWREMLLEDGRRVLRRLSEIRSLTSLYGLNH